ncbi:MAG: shikimate dehydrogenase [Ardenticatenaceae bacterium]|nr:shikimate dehydrogenase [Ardenticatenaceae bacterium]
MIDYRLGLTGYPLGHSLSPGLHNAALAAAGLAGEYGLYPVAPGDAAGLAALLARLRSGELHGLNVTIPHKQAVMPLLDELTPAAQAIGAVNTVGIKQLAISNEQLAKKSANLQSPISNLQSLFMLWGDNTDAPGFLRDVGRFLGDGAAPSSALVLGAGGSARAVVYALAGAGWRVTVAARRLAQAQELAVQMGQVGVVTAVALTAAELRNQKPGLLVNTTPVGMSPNVDASPWPEG